MYDRILLLLENTPWLQSMIAVIALILVSTIAYLVMKKILVRLVFKLLSTSNFGRTRNLSEEFRFIPHLANIVPALVISTGVAHIPHLPDVAIVIIQNVCDAFIVFTAALALGNIADLLGDALQKRPDGTLRPVKGYFQIAKIATYALATILIISALLDKSPLILFSGLGALAAVLMLVFQDTLLSFVASVQIASNNIVRVGDWIEMPQLNADGDVIDIALHTVKVQNWDKTITTIPTRRLISDPFKNWRGMRESGGRRIKRPLFIDQQSIRFLTDEEKARLINFSLLRDYLERKQKEIDDWNARLAEQGREPANMRRITNIGTFRAYVENYLRNHPGIHQGMTLIVRQLSPGSTGIPLEIYCFTNDTAWVAYESIQSDIFDHLLSILPEFGLRVFQDPSGSDFRNLKS